MKKLLFWTVIFQPLFANALLTHHDLVGRYQVSHSMIELTLVITADNSIKLYERPSNPEEDYIDCKANTYRIKDNFLESTLACAYKGTKQFRADLSNISPEQLAMGVKVPVEAFGHSLIVFIKRH